MNGSEVRPAKWSDVIDLYDDGDYSAIWGRYEGALKRVLGVRWDGYGDGKGFPLSSGHPVWHVEPDFLAKGILPVLLEQTIRSANTFGCKDNIVTAMTELGLRCNSNSIHLAVALYAAAGRGKTTTLNKLIETLKQSGEETKVIEERYVWEGSADSLFCCKYKGKTVGIATGGDDNELIKIAFEFFNKYNCDIVFCATRSRSDSYSWKEFYESTTAHNIRIMCVKKREADESEQDAVNSEQAKELADIIEKN